MCMQARAEDFSRVEGSEKIAGIIHFVALFTLTLGRGKGRGLTSCGLIIEGNLENGKWLKGRGGGAEGWVSTPNCSPSERH